MPAHGQRIGQIAIAQAKLGGGSGSAPPAMATPVLTAPSNGASITNGTPVTVSATSTDGDLTRMDWVLDGSTVIATDSVAPYSQSWTPTGLSNGSHTLIARAVRGAQTKDSTSITINAGGGTSPAVPILTAPSNGASIQNGVAVTLSATSTDGDLDRIDWILDPSGAATVVGTDSVAPYSQSWTPTGVSTGAHTLIARAVRGGFTTDSTAITINLIVAPATPTLTAPTNGTNIQNGVALTVSATSTNGDLTRIDWILDPAGSATVVATDSVAPYSQSWTPTGVSTGAHVLVARAVRSGLTTDSTSITINLVVAPAVPTLTAPSTGASLFNGVALTVSATSTDSDLDRIDWVIDPGGGETVVATDAASPYSQSWTPAAFSTGTHTLVARAVRSGLSTDSASITVNLGERLWTLVTTMTCLRAWQTDFGVHDTGSALCDSFTDQKNTVPALQATVGNQPAIVANVVGIRTALRGDGVDDFLRDATLDFGTPSSQQPFLWGIAIQRAWTNNRLLWCSGTTAGTFQLFQNTTVGDLSAYNGIVGPHVTGATIGSPFLIEQFMTGSTNDYLKAASSIGTGVSLGNADPVAGFNMFATSAGASAGAFDLFCCLIFQGKPSGPELSALRVAALGMYPGLLTTQYRAIAGSDLHDSKSAARSAQTSQLTSRPYTLREANARFIFTSDATTIYVTCMQDTLSVPGGFNSVGVYLDGVAQGSGIQMGTALGIETVQAFTASAGTHTWEIVDGPAYQRGAYPSPAIGGSPAISVQVPAGNSINVVSPTTPAKRIVIIGDSIMLGASVTSGSGVYQGPGMLMRANALNAQSGAFAGARLINFSAAGRQLRDIGGDATVTTPIVAAISAQCDGSSANIVVIALGTNDYAANSPASSFQTWLGNFVDAIHAAVPSAQVLLYAPINRVSPASEAANAGGSTLGDYRTATLAVQTARSAYCSFRSGAGVVWAANMASDGVHPIGGGMQQIEADMSFAVGYSVARQLWALTSSVTCVRAWQSDFGVTMGDTPLASGTTPPVITVTGSASVTPALRIEIQTTGALGVATFRYGANNNGTTSGWIEQNVVIPGGGTYSPINALAGITFNFPAGTYTNDNVYQGTCSSWTDQKNSTTATQATASKQPLILVTSTGRLFLRFDGADDFLSESTFNPPAPTTTPLYVSGVWSQRTWTANKSVYGAGAGNVQLVGQTSTPSMKAYNGTFSSAVAATLGVLYRSENLFIGTTSDYLKIGASSVTGVNTGTTDPAAGWNIGASTSAGGNAGAFDVYYLALFTGNPSAGEKTSTDSAMVALYPGITT